MLCCVLFYYVTSSKDDLGIFAIHPHSPVGEGGGFAQPPHGIDSRHSLLWLLISTMKKATIFVLLSLLALCCCETCFTEDSDDCRITVQKPAAPVDCLAAPNATCWIL